LETNRARIEVIDAIIAGLKSGKVEGRGRGAETPRAAVEDRLTTIESSDREQAAHLTRKMDESDLVMLARTERERLGAVGLRLAESTPAQTVGEVAIPLLGGIVTERWEEEQAVANLSRALAHGGGSTEPIDVSDSEELTELEITRSGDMVLIRKTPLKQGLEALDAARTGKATLAPASYLKKPFELVTIRQLGSGKSVTLPAFALLHAEDRARVGTYATWAAIAELGVSFGAALVRGARATGAIDELGSAALKADTSPALRAGAVADESAVARTAGSSAAAERASASRASAASTRELESASKRLSSTSPEGTGVALDSPGAQLTKAETRGVVRAPEHGTNVRQGKASSVIQTRKEVRETSTELGRVAEPRRAASRQMSSVPQKNLAIAEGGRITAQGEKLVWQHKYISYAKHGVEKRIEQLIKQFEKSVQNRPRWASARRNWNETHKGAVGFELPESASDPSIVVELDIGMAGRRSEDWPAIEERLRSYFASQKGIPPNARLNFWWDETLLTADEILR
jgi:hypothetical protein